MKPNCRESPKGHTNTREHSGGYESDGNRRNGSRLFPAQCFELLEVGGDFSFPVELVVIIKTKITISVARLKDSVNGNQHGVSNCHGGTVSPPSDN